MERVFHLTNKIYREILCITRHERPGMTNITIVGIEHLQVSAFSWNSQYRLALSWDFLDWMEGIPCFFTNFITTPELSGPLYISPDIYHTQITEYLLERIHQWALFSLHLNHFGTNCSVRPFPSFIYFLEPVWGFREHLSRALPTEMILNLLRSIPLKHIILDYSVESSLDMLENIVDWLQVSVE